MRLGRVRGLSRSAGVAGLAGGSRAADGEDEYADEEQQRGEKQDDNAHYIIAVSPCRGKMLNAGFGEIKEEMDVPLEFTAARSVHTGLYRNDGPEMSEFFPQGPSQRQPFSGENYLLGMLRAGQRRLFGEVYY